MKQWEEVTFGDVFEISSAKRVTKSQWKNEGVPFYRAREVVKLAREGAVENELFISEEMFQEYSNKYGVPNHGDLMVSGVGTLGACYVVKPGDRFYYKDASVLRFHPKREICADYFKHAFRTRLVLDQVEAGSGSTVGTYTISRAQRTRVPLPPLSEQKRIAEILDRAEALRAKRRAALALLDELTQSIFLDMFGDPVTNPKGWPIGIIGDLLDSANYGTSNKASSDGEFPVLRMNNITRTGEMDYSDLKYMDLPKDKRDRFLVRKGDVLFNRTNSVDLVGKTGMFDEPEPMAYAGYLIRLRLKKANRPEYLSSFLNTQYAKLVLRGMCKSIIGMANINAKEIQAMKIALPPTELQSEFATRTMAANDLKVVHKKFLAELDQLFASLQHRAFRGEL